MLLSSCVSKQKKSELQENQIITERENLRIVLVSLSERGPVNYHKIENPTKEQIELQDSVQLIVNKMDSLDRLIEEFPNYVHPWADKPYADIFDEIHTNYRIEQMGPDWYFLCDKATNENIKFNMEDMTKLKALVMKYLPFEPLTDAYSIMTWTASKYNIQITYAGSKDLQILCELK